MSQQCCEFGPFRLDRQRRQLWREGQVVSLTPKAIEILMALVERRGDLISKNELMETLWPNSYVEEGNLTQNIFLLRKALGESAQDHNFILTVPGQGYRFAAEVRESTGGNGTSAHAEAVATAEASPAEPLPAAPVPEAIRVHHPSWIRRNWLWVGAAVVLLALASSVAYLKGRADRHPPSPAGRVIMFVQPFQNLTGDPAQDYLAEGFTEEMVAQLGRIDPQRLGVIGSPPIARYQASPNQIRDLGVRYVLQGSVRRDRGRVRITAKLIQSDDQTNLWSRSYDRELTSLLAVQNEISQEIADEIQLVLSGFSGGKTIRVVAPAPTASYEAYDLYLRGRYFWNKRIGGFVRAAEYFQQAIAEDPKYARAYAGLADTYALMSTWSQVPADEYMAKARAAALKALELDNSLAEAHTSLALIAESYDYDWDTAEKEYRRAIQLNPGYATAHQWYAECLSFEGRFDEALAESQRARQLDPLSVIIAADHSANLYFARQYDRTIEQSRAVLEMDPESSRAADFMIFAYVQQGRFPEALAQLDALERSVPSPWHLNIRAYIYARWGKKAEAARVQAEFERKIKLFPEDPSPFRLNFYLAMEDKAETMAILQEAYAQHSNLLTLIKVDPKFDFLRDDPRFQELLRKVGLQR